METGQILHIKSKNKDNYWQVKSICLGAVNQESVIHIRRVDGFKRPTCLGEGLVMFVPEIMIKRLIENGEIKILDKADFNKLKIMDSLK